MGPHSGHADDVGLCAPLEIDRLDVLVDDSEAMPRRGQAASNGKAATRSAARLPIKGNACSSPKRKIEARVYENDIGHRRLGPVEKTLSPVSAASPVRQTFPCSAASVRPRECRGRETQSIYVAILSQGISGNGWKPAEILSLACDTLQHEKAAKSWPVWS